MARLIPDALEKRHREATDAWEAAITYTAGAKFDFPAEYRARVAALQPLIAVYNEAQIAVSRSGRTGVLWWALHRAADDVKREIAELERDARESEEASARLQATRDSLRSP